MLLILIVLLCGCTVKEEVVVDPYGKVSQKVTIPINTNGKNESDLREYSNLVVTPYKPALNIRKYNVDTEYGKKKSKIIISNDFKNICEYIKNTVFSQYIYKHITCTEDSDYITLENVTDHINYCADCSSWPALDNVTFSLTLPVKALEDNSDYVNDRTYVWKYDKNTEKSKGFYIKISKKDLENNLKQYEQSTKTKNMLSKIIVNVVVIGLIIASFLIVKKAYKKMEENKLDY